MRRASDFRVRGFGALRLVGGISDLGLLLGFKRALEARLNDINNEQDSDGEVECRLRHGLDLIAKQRHVRDVPALRQQHNPNDQQYEQP